MLILSSTHGLLAHTVREREYGLVPFSFAPIRMNSRLWVACWYFQSNDFEKYQLYLASEKLYHYVWHTLADKILEESKLILAGDDVEARRSRQYTLYTLLTTSLKMLHPFMPFITEEIWQSLPARLPHKESDILMAARWPEKAV